MLKIFSNKCLCNWTLFVLRMHDGGEGYVYNHDYGNENSVMSSDSIPGKTFEKQ
ncbi:hypothetical protein KSU1_D0641 [Candidatus Jettenia caeni]|uniref:Uncharacterized protein n=1 Tax=Candidatus Jettenia caeni TaxID=247490 RepID=I3IQF5_9BACT|nr:hypothetical protein KSU1_D0641 [Candidatus Jettenia caeni]